MRAALKIRIGTGFEDRQYGLAALFANCIYLAKVITLSGTVAFYIFCGYQRTRGDSAPLHSAMRLTS